MLGDLFLKVKDIIKKNFCMHEYKITHRQSGRQYFNIYTCEKCGYEKVKEV